MIGLGLSITQLAVRQLVGQFNPLKLFALGEQGAWYDPGDLTTLYQDAAGTTPVTAVEQPVGLMLDKSRGLVLGPELVTNASGTVFRDNVNQEVRYTPGIIVTAGKSYEIRITVSNNIGNSNAGWRVDNSTIPSTNTIAGGNNGTVVSRITAHVDGPLLLVGNNAVVSFSVSEASIRELPGNHAFQTTATSRPVLSARYNLLTKTESLAEAPWVNSSGTSVIATPGQDDPNGGTNAVLISNLTTTGGAGTYRQLAAKSTPNTPLLPSVRIKKSSQTGVLRISNPYSGASGDWSVNLSALSDGWEFLTAEHPAVTVVNSWVSSSSGDLGMQFGVVSGGPLDIFVFGASLVPANQADLPYQRVNTATDYQTIGFLSGEAFDGVDDSQIASSGGGSTTKFFWCGAIQCKKIGQAQTLFSDAGTNTGYRVRINASNQLELSAGNGTAYTTVATAGTMAIGQRAVLTAWHDGTSLNVQIDNGTVATAAFVTATAGTAQFTMGKDNNAASSFFGGWLYEKVYLKDDVPSDAEIVSTKQYMAAAAGVTI